MRINFKAAILIGLLISASAASASVVELDFSQPDWVYARPHRPYDLTGGKSGFMFHTSVQSLDTGTLALSDSIWLDGRLLSSTVMREDQRPFDFLGWNPGMTNAAINTTGGKPVPEFGSEEWETWQYAGGRLIDAPLKFMGLTQAGKVIEWNPRLAQAEDGRPMRAPPFKDILALTITLSDFNNDRLREDFNAPETPRTDWCFEFCSNVQISSLTVGVDTPSQVPLPAGGALLAASAGVFGVMSRRRRG